MFVWNRLPPHPWVEDLRSISPPHDNLSHAELWWEPGFPWAPVQRWMVYTLTPRHGIAKALEVDAYLDAEFPCPCAVEWTRGEIASASVYCPTCGGNRSKAWRDIHHAWTDRKFFAQPLFVLQGDHGGHRTSYTAIESKMAAALGQPNRAPALGSLPYTDWDRRSRERLLAFDLAQSRQASLRSARAEDRAVLERSVRVAQQQYLNASFDEIRDNTDLRLVDDLPRDPTLRPVDDSALTAQYIETGRI